MPDFPKVGGATAAEVATAILVNPSNKVDGSKVDAAISTRAPETGGNVATIMAKTNVIGASVALEGGGNLATVMAKTDNLPTAPADESLVEAAIATRASATDYTAGRAAKMDKIQDFLEEGNGTLTADGLLQTVREYTGLGKLHVYIDLTNMGASDTVVVSQSMKIKVAGNYGKYAEETYAGAQSLPLLHIVMKPGKYGVKVTLQQTAKNGGYKGFDWETLVEQAAA